jgi:hypothetical protein
MEYNQELNIGTSSIKIDPKGISVRHIDGDIFDVHEDSSHNVWHNISVSYRADGIYVYKNGILLAKKDQTLIIMHNDVILRDTHIHTELDNYDIGSINISKYDSAKVFSSAIDNIMNYETCSVHYLFDSSRTIMNTVLDPAKTHTLEISDNIIGNAMTRVTRLASNTGTLLDAQAVSLRYVDNSCILGSGDHIGLLWNTVFSDVGAIDHINVEVDIPLKTGQMITMNEWTFDVSANSSLFQATSTNVIPIDVSGVVVYPELTYRNRVYTFPSLYLTTTAYGQQVVQIESIMSDRMDNPAKACVGDVVTLSWITRYPASTNDFNITIGDNIGIIIKESYGRFWKAMYKVSDATSLGVLPWSLNDLHHPDFKAPIYVVSKESLTRNVRVYDIYSNRVHPEHRYFASPGDTVYIDWNTNITTDVKQVMCYFDISGIRPIVRNDCSGGPVDWSGSYMVTDDTTMGSLSWGINAGSSFLTSELYDASNVAIVHPDYYKQFMQYVSIISDIGAYPMYARPGSRVTIAWTTKWNANATDFQVLFDVCGNNPVLGRVNRLSDNPRSWIAWFRVKWTTTHGNLTYQVTMPNIIDANKINHLSGLGPIFVSAFPPTIEGELVEELADGILFNVRANTYDVMIVKIQIMAFNIYDKVESRLVYDDVNQPFFIKNNIYLALNVETLLEIQVNVVDMLGGDFIETVFVSS